MELLQAGSGVSTEIEPLIPGDPATLQAVLHTNGEET